MLLRGRGRLEQGSGSTGIAIGERRAAGLGDGGNERRCVAVSAAGVVEALRSVYDAAGILAELEEQALPGI